MTENVMRILQNRASSQTHDSRTTQSKMDAAFFVVVAGLRNQLPQVLVKELECAFRPVWQRFRQNAARVVVEALPSFKPH
jgi:hypothetical protein